MCDIFTYYMQAVELCETSHGDSLVHTKNNIV